MGHRIGVGENYFNVEHDEQHRHQIKRHRKTFGRLAAWHDAAFIRRIFGRVWSIRCQKLRGHEAEGGEYNSECGEHHYR